MDKDRVAEILDEIGTLLSLQGENPFRCLAYSNAARNIRQMEENLSEVIAQDRLATMAGIGKTLDEKIRTLMATGELPFYEDLKKKTPAGLLAMLKLPGMGPKKVKALYDELGIDSVEKLEAACEQGKVAALKGFGEKTQQKILEGITFIGLAGKRVRLDQAEAIANALVAGLRKAPGISRLAVCGSLRRRKETINDIDILISSENPGPIMDCFVHLAGVAEVVGHGDTKSSIIVDSSLLGSEALRINADLRVVRDEQFPFALHYFTGSKEHNIAVRARAQDYGLKLNEYELAGPRKTVECKEEADIFQALDLDYIEPELRENTGEIEAALEHRLPHLVEARDLKGTFHCHTNWSDGAASLEHMVEAARESGFDYFGVADHSPSLTVANGLSPARVRQQQAAIDKINSRLKGIRVFKGIECDILADGSLDYADEVLNTFDYVVASVHSHFNQPEKEMTARIVKAISHPRVSILGHATGRLLLRRESYKLDMDAVFQTAAKHSTLIEINAHPMRLDIDWIQCKRAKAMGVKLVINPDAHATDEVKYVRFGVDVARRGWLEKGDIFNTQTAAQIAKAFAVRGGQKVKKA
jgi:DNA polymerase (family 10)